MEMNPLLNWIPFRLSKEEGLCDWLYLGENRFVEPFFDETIAHCRSLPENSSRYKPAGSFEFLNEAAGLVQALPPAAFIFHVSRCGSTLLSQLFSLDESNIVLSETPLFDELLRKGKRDGVLNGYLPLLNDSIRLYSAQRTKAEKRVFIKTDSWHIHFYTELRELFPATPFILLYRYPAEVLRSQQNRRGMQSVQGVLEPGIFGFDENEIKHLSMDVYMQRVLETYLSAFLRIMNIDPNVHLLNYNEGAMPMVYRIAEISGYPIPGEVREKMQARAVYHGKYPSEKFSESGDITIPPGSETLSGLYQALELRRISPKE